MKLAITSEKIKTEILNFTKKPSEKIKTEILNFTKKPLIRGANLEKKT